MKLTTNYGLKKPDASDIVNIDDFNYNADAIDSAIKEVKTKVDSLNLTATNVKMSDGSTVQTTVTTNKSNISTLQSEVSANKTSIHLLNEELFGCKDALKKILIDKKIKGVENENNLSNLINKVNEFDDYKERFWIYKDGDEYTSVTGGFTIGNFGHAKSTMGDSSIIQEVTGGGSSTLIKTKNTIDISKLNELIVTLNSTASGQYSVGIKLYILNNNDEVVLSYDTGETQVTYLYAYLNVSNITGYHRIAFESYAYGNTIQGNRLRTTEIYKIWAQ